MSAEHTITIRHLCKKYGKKTALKDFSFTFDSGHCYGILGINGAGKSTLVSCITGNAKYTGTIEWHGLDRRTLGYVPQELAIYNELSCIDNLMYFGSLYKNQSKAELKDWADVLIERTGLSEKRKQAASTLSGGMKRKLNLACGLIHRPRLLLCDEVTVGIDPISRQEILDFIQTLTEDGMSILYTSHYLDEVDALCDQLLVIHDGEILTSGDKNTIKNQVESPGQSLQDIFVQLIRKEK